MGDQVSNFKKHIMCKNPTLRNALKTLGTICRYWTAGYDYDEEWVTTVACFWVQMYPKTEENVKLVDKYIIPYENDKYNIDDRKDLILKMLDTKTFSMELIYNYVNSEQPCHGEETIITIIMQHIHFCSEYYSNDDVKRIINELFIPSIREMEKSAYSFNNYRYKVGLESILRTAKLNSTKFRKIVPTDKRLNNPSLIKEAADMITKFEVARKEMRRSNYFVSA